MMIYMHFGEMRLLKKSFPGWNLRPLHAKMSSCRKILLPLLKSKNEHKCSLCEDITKKELLCSLYFYHMFRRKWHFEEKYTF